MAQVADGRRGDLRVPLQNIPEHRFVRRAEYPGQHRAELRLPDIGHQVHLIQQLRRDIHDGGPFRQQLGRQLIGPADGHGKVQLRRARRGLRQGRGGQFTALRSVHPPIRQLVQQLPPQRVHRAGGHHQPLVQPYFDLIRREHRAAGLGQPLPQFLLRHGAVSRLLRHVARSHAHGHAVPDGARAAQPHRFAPAHRQPQVHRYFPYVSRAAANSAFGSGTFSGRVPNMALPFLPSQ